MPTKRIEWIDLCKGLGIFLVVIGHTSIAQVSQTLYDWIYSFHMPLFYMLSGMVFNEKKYDTFGKYLRRRWRSLIVPFFVLNAATWLCFRLVSVQGIEPTMGNLFTGISAMYFIRVLFLSEVWHFWLKRLLKHEVWVLFVVLGFLELQEYVIPRELLSDYGWMLLPATPLLYYSLGHALRNLDLDRLVSLPRAGVSAAMLLAVALSLWLLRFPSEFHLQILKALVGICSLCAFSLLLAGTSWHAVKRAVLYMGLNTLVIVAAHPFIYNALKYITAPWIPNRMGEAAVRMGLLWMCLVLLITCFNRYFYWVLGKSRPASKTLVKE